MFTQPDQSASAAAGTVSVARLAGTDRVTSHLKILSAALISVRPDRHAVDFDTAPLYLDWLNTGECAGFKEFHNI